MDIYVGNLPYDVDQQTIRSAFEEYGTVGAINIIEDRETGRPKGFAFLTMDNTEEANAAIGALDGATINGRPIKVNESKPREQRPRRFDGGGHRGGPRGGGSNYRNNRY
jgi:RNA recognition motif-containing protein